jgi:hypothetical protein
MPSEVRYFFNIHSLLIGLALEVPRRHLVQSNAARMVLLAYPSRRCMRGTLRPAP